MSMREERRQFSQLVVKRLLAYQHTELPIEASHFVREVLELMVQQHQCQMQQLKAMQETLKHLSRQQNDGPMHH